MRSIERAQRYAALFTAVQDDGKPWRSVRPVDGHPHRDDDRMVLDGVTIARPDPEQPWQVIET